MPRHTLRPLPSALSGGSASAGRGHARLAQAYDEDVWARLDRAQVLGSRDEGHRGCVNALSWSDDGSTLLSGSDDKRICIWSADDSPSPSNVSPHPLKLRESILTGHRANIFSARYLPNAGTPTIVSCAGDRDVRVFEVERLARAEVGLGGREREELSGIEGPGVTILRCHRDRTKRIATENSPYLFLTVSEDGTVRQHDLRRPHRCRSECPDVLFHAPRGVDLYSLSVSTVTPHVFGVAGRTDSAFVCDRRMTERQTPSWGVHTVRSGQVNCVRRLGLSDADWASVDPGNSMYAGERHVTCVKMSPEHADEVICAFARHSTSLFSTYDSPPSASARHASPGVGTSPRHRRHSRSHSPLAPTAPAPATGPGQTLSAEDFLRSPQADVPASSPGPSTSREAPASTTNVDDAAPGPSLATASSSHGIAFEGAGAGGSASPGVKRRLSERSEHAAAQHSDFSEGVQASGPSSAKRREGASVPLPGKTSEDTVQRVTGLEEPFVGPVMPRVGDEEDDRRELMYEPEEDDEDVELAQMEATFAQHRARLGLPPIAARGTLLQPDARAGSSAAPDRLPSRVGAVTGPRGDIDMNRSDDAANNRATYQTDASGNLARLIADFQDGMDNEADEFGFYEEDEDALEDEDAFDDEEDGDDIDDDDDDFDDDDDDDDDEGQPYGLDDMLSDPRSADGEFAPVPMILPRRSFKGARNYETVKDCNFLGFGGGGGAGAGSKVCSGSDDGNWFVWDKATGRLEGIWEGDGSVVNVMEQHPTLPLVAVSGIDSTVKIFAPLASPPDPSYARKDLAEGIIRRNTSARRSGGSRFAPSFGQMDQLALLQQLFARRTLRSGAGGGATAAVGGGEGAMQVDHDEDDEDDEGDDARLNECATQ